MFTKRILCAAVAGVLMSGTASAFDLKTGAASLGAYTVAKQTLNSASETATGSGLYVLNEVSATGHQFQLDLGFGVSNGDTRYITVTLTNGVFTQTVNHDSANLGSGARLVIPGSNNITRVSGGTAGTSTVTYQFTANANIAPEQDIEIQFAGTAIAIPATGGLGFSYELKNGTGVNATSLASDSATGLITVADGYAATITATSATANVEATPAFSRFISGSGLIDTTTARIGQIQVAVVNNTYKNANNIDSTDLTAGNGAALATMINAATSTVTLAGNFAFGTWYLGDVSCNQTVALTGLADGASDALALTAVNNQYLCVDNNGTTVIQKDGVYTATADYTGVAGAVGTLADQVVNFGTFAHNGTTIQLPYITTLLNQKLVLVNRSGAAATYEFSFPNRGTTTTEPTTTGSYTGSIPANSATTLELKDVVTITGQNKVAGTIVVAAPACSVDAITIYPRPNASTDPVTLDTGCLAQKIDTVGTSVAAVNTSVNAVDESVAAVQTSIGTTGGTSLVTRLTTVNSNLDAVDNALEAAFTAAGAAQGAAYGAAAAAGGAF